MTEKRNILQNLVEKPKQAIINLATMVKTRIAECEEKERQRREIYLTTPPTNNSPNIRYETTGLVVNAGYRTKYEYTWTPDQSRWVLTNTEEIWIPGTMH